MCENQVISRDRNVTKEELEGYSISEIGGRGSDHISEWNKIATSSHITNTIIKSNAIENKAIGK